jgi:GxxExxY protein
LTDLSGRIIGAAIEVHRALGPGLLESAYEACLAHELTLQGFRVERQKPIPVRYKGVMLDCGSRLDLLVDDCIVVELKAVNSVNAIFEAQLLSHLKLLDKRLGLLINLHVSRLYEGVTRVANGI